MTRDKIFISFSASLFLAELPTIENETYIPVVALNAGFLTQIFCPLTACP